MRTPLWSRQVGHDASVPILLLSGAFSNARDWPHSITDAFGTRPSIFLDHRDTGRNAWCADAMYTLDDMTDDVEHFMVAKRIRRAHLVGASMGGSIAQRMSIRHPTRVASLTLVMSTPGRGVWDPVLPPPTHETLEAMRREYDAFVRGDAREALMLRYRCHDTDSSEKELTQRIDRVLRHGLNPTAGHGRAFATSSPLSGRLVQIDAPTLIVHGRRDAIFSVGHAQFLHENIRRSRLVQIDAGHHVSEDVGRRLSRLIRAHVDEAERAEKTR